MRHPAYAGGMFSGQRARIAAVLAAGVTEPPAPRPRQLRRGRVDLVFLADTASALILFAITINVFTGQNARQGSPVSAGLIALAAAVICAAAGAPHPAPAHRLDHVHPRHALGQPGVSRGTRSCRAPTSSPG